MMKQNVTINRYADPNLAWEASIEPEDGSWILFTRRDGGRPALWLRAPNGSFSPAA